MKRNGCWDTTLQSWFVKFSLLNFFFRPANGPAERTASKPPATTAQAWSYGYYLSILQVWALVRIVDLEILSGKGRWPNLKKSVFVSFAALLPPKQNSAYPWTSFLDSLQYFTHFVPYNVPMNRISSQRNGHSKFSFFKSKILSFQNTELKWYIITFMIL